MVKDFDIFGPKKLPSLRDHVRLETNALVGRTGDSAREKAHQIAEASKSEATSIKTRIISWCQNKTSQWRIVRFWTSFVERENARIGFERNQTTIVAIQGSVNK